MAGRTVKSFPPEFPLLIMRVISEKATIRIPCETHGQEINLAVRFRHYVKLLRETPMEQLPGSHYDARQLLETCHVSVMGGKKDSARKDFAITLMPYQAENDPLLRALEGWAPPVPTVKPETQITAAAPGNLLRSFPRNDAELMDIAQGNNMIAMKLLSPAQKNRMEELMLGVSPEPGRITE